MKFSDICNLKTVVAHRSELMGLAILWVFMLHSGTIGNPIYDAIRKFGWAGVDIFFFLSALGLCYSLKKNNNLKDFYNRRINRILPTWLVVLFVVHMIGLVCNRYMPSLPFHVPNTIAQCLTWYSGIGYWISDFLTNPDGYYYEWYIPSLLAFYLVTPFLYKQKSFTLILLTIVSVIISIILSNHHILYSLHFFYQRIPIFLLGLLSYRMIQIPQNPSIEKMSFFGIVIMFMVGIILLFFKEKYSVNIVITHIVQLMILLLLLFFSVIIDFLHINKILSFYGGISLELYLIHLYKRPLYLMSFITNSKIFAIILSLILCTLVAVVLQRLINVVFKR